MFPTIYLLASWSCQDLGLEDAMFDHFHWEQNPRRRRRQTRRTRHTIWKINTKERHAKRTKANLHYFKFSLHFVVITKLLQFWSKLFRFIGLHKLPRLSGLGDKCKPSNRRTFFCSSFERTSALFWPTASTSDTFCFWASTERERDSVSISRPTICFSRALTLIQGLMSIHNATTNCDQPFRRLGPATHGFNFCAQNFLKITSEESKTYRNNSLYVSMFKRHNATIRTI